LAADDELTQEEIYALAGTFDVTAANTLLKLADFPPYAIPVTGFGNPLEFWSMIADQIAKGVMTNGRRRILAAAKRRYPAGNLFADSALPAEPKVSRHPPVIAESVLVTDARGVQFGDGAVQINFYAGKNPAEPDHDGS
jgi:Effector-associated domain 1